MISVEALAKEAYQLYSRSEAVFTAQIGTVTPPSWEHLPWWLQGVWCDVVRKVLELAKPAIL